MEHFQVNNQCQSLSDTLSLPDTDPNDGCEVERISYPGCSQGAKVELLRVIGGGHTWPGGWEYLGEDLIGRTCHDFNACEEIWRFFASL